MTTVQLSEDAFATIFRPKANHLNPNASFDWGDGYGTLFETYGEELLYVRSQRPDTIWTLLTGDDGDVIVSGFHFVNRLGYFISETPVPPRLDVVVPLEGIDSSEPFPLEIVSRSSVAITDSEDSMTKTLAVTVQISVNPTLYGSTTNLVAQLPQMLRSRLSDLLTDVPNALTITELGNVAISNAGLIADLAAEHKVAFIWSVDDVLNIRPDLSMEQAWQALLLAKHNHDANFGVNWDVLNAIAESLYGDGPEPQEY